MFGFSPKGANAYAKVGLETGVAASSPHQLIVMLFDGALVAVRNAITHMKAGDVPKKGQAISKAIMIIDDGLRMSLDKKAGGEIAANLDALYAYMSGRLLEANLHNRIDYLEEVYRLLADLKSAWDAIGEQAKQAGAPAAPAAPAAPRRMAGFDNLAPRTATLVAAG